MHRSMSRTMSRTASAKPTPRTAAAARGPCGATADADSAGGGGSRMATPRSTTAVQQPEDLDAGLLIEDLPPLPPRPALSVSLLPPPASAGGGGTGTTAAGYGSDSGGAGASVASGPSTMMGGACGSSLVDWPAALGPPSLVSYAPSQPQSSYAQPNSVALSGLPPAGATSLVGSAAAAGSDAGGAGTLSKTDPSLAQAMQPPTASYRSPHRGLASAAGTRVSTIRSTRHRSCLEPDHGTQQAAPEPRLNDSVPRPVTVLAASVSDLLAAKQARQANGQRGGLALDGGASSSRGAIGVGGGTGTGEASDGKVPASPSAGGGGGGGGPGAAHRLSGGGGAAGYDSLPVEEQVLAPQPLAVMVATGDGGTDRLYRFPRDLLSHPRHMCLFEHVEGCRFCEALYGHYLLPSGRLAHFYLGDTVVKGHRVDLVPPPAIPFSAADWAQDGFQGCTALAEAGALLPGRVAPNELLQPLWCPLPLLAPPPHGQPTLEWGPRGPSGGGCDLQLRTVCLAAQLLPASRTDVKQLVVAPPPPPTPKGKKKKKPAAAGAAAPGSPLKK